MARKRRHKTLVPIENAMLAKRMTAIPTRARFGEHLPRYHRKAERGFPIHERIPVLLGRHDLEAWLIGKAGVEPLRPARNDLPRMWPVLPLKAEESEEVRVPWSAFAASNRGSRRRLEREVALKRQRMPGVGHSLLRQGCMLYGLIPTMPKPCRWTRPSGWALYQEAIP
jgi:hypothetical protein